MDVPYIVAAALAGALGVRWITARVARRPALSTAVFPPAARFDHNRAQLRDAAATLFTDEAPDGPDALRGRYGDAMARLGFALFEAYGGAGGAWRTRWELALDLQGAAEPFRVMPRDMPRPVGGVSYPAYDVPTGDARFDAHWLVSGDPVVARAAVDPAVRRALAHLREGAVEGSLDLGQIVIEADGPRLLCRLDGELAPERGRRALEVLARVREAILAEVQRRASSPHRAAPFRGHAGEAPAAPSGAQPRAQRAGGGRGDA